MTKAPDLGATVMVFKPLASRGEMKPHWREPRGYLFRPLWVTQGGFMQDKHTPGSWEAMGTWVRSPMHQPEGLPRGVQIAECWDGYFLPHTEEARANARLMATAPELLEVARHCEKLLMSYEINRINGDEISEEALSLIRSAIAKAVRSTP